MRIFSKTILVVAFSALLLTSCGAAIAALLVRELLNDEAPKRTWIGNVTDSDGAAVGGVLVQVKAEVSGDTDNVSFSDETDNNGDYRIGYRWNKDVNYTIRVVFQDEVLAEQFVGKVELGDQTTNFILPASS
jgi:hypothetical protein